MNTDTLKCEMMKLWKHTFHDSDDYISLIFDNYFNPDLVEYEERDGKLVAAMLAVPYDFYMAPNCKKESNNCLNAYFVDVCRVENIDTEVSNVRPSYDADSLIRGLYLCGLATSEESRGFGIMSRMIERINVKAAQLGYAFTFLIPASDGLHKYYSDRGYLSAMYRYENLYTSEHDFYNDLKNYIKCIENADSERQGKIDKIYYGNNIYDIAKSLISKDNYKETFEEIKIFVILKNTIEIYCESTGKLISENFDNNKSSNHYKLEKYLEDASVFLCEIESKICANSLDLSLRHSQKDFYAILLDCIYSNGEIICAYSDNSLIGILLSYPNDEDNYIEVKRVFAQDVCVYYKLLNLLKIKYPDKGIAICKYSSDDSEPALWRPFFVSSSTSSSYSDAIGYSLQPTPNLSKVYGMLRVTNLSQILKLIAGNASCPDFSILVDVADLQYLGLDAEFESENMANRDDTCAECNESGDNVYQNVQYKEEPIECLKKFQMRIAHSDGRNLLEFEHPESSGCMARKVEAIRFKCRDSKLTIDMVDKDGKLICPVGESFSVDFSEGKINLNGKISLKEVAALLFRKKRFDREVEAAIEIPRIECSISLMLD